MDAIKVFVDISQLTCAHIIQVLKNYLLYLTATDFVSNLLQQVQ